MMARAKKESVRQWISRYITHLRTVQPILTGHELENLGFLPGPQFRTILDDLLGARLDDRVATLADEKAYVLRKYGKGISGRGTRDAENLESKPSITRLE